MSDSFVRGEDWALVESGLVESEDWRRWRQRARQLATRMEMAGNPTEKRRIGREIEELKRVEPARARGRGPVLS